MLTLAKVLCLLLAAKVTSAWVPSSLDTAKQSFDEALHLSLAQMNESYNENLECVRAAYLNLTAEIDHLEDELSRHSSDPELVKAVVGVTVAAKNRSSSINERNIRLDEIFKTERELLKEKQLLADTCISSYPDNILGSWRAAWCINKVRKTMSEKVKHAKLYFSTECEAAEEAVKTALTYIKGTKHILSGTLKL